MTWKHFFPFWLNILFIQLNISEEINYFTLESFFSSFLPLFSSADSLVLLAVFRLAISVAAENFDFD